MADHGHKPKFPYPIPKADIYNFEEVPQLKKLHDRLAKEGLKDPWIRNQAWRFPSKKWSHVGHSMLAFFARGLVIGIPAFLITISIERYFDIDYHLLGYDHVSNPDRHLPPPRHHH